MGLVLNEHIPDKQVQATLDVPVKSTRRRGSGVRVRDIQIAGPLLIRVRLGVKGRVRHLWSGLGFGLRC